MKPVRWQILHEGKVVGHLIDSTGGDSLFACYEVLPTKGCQELLTNTDLWQRRVFQFRHPKTKEVLTDHLGACGSKDEVARRLRESKVILSRLQTDQEREGVIDAVLVKRWFERLCEIKNKIIGGYRETDALECFRVQHPVEPVHEGRTVSSWIEDVFLLDEAGSQRACEAILGMGEPAVPFLYKLVRFPGDLPQRTWAVEREEFLADSWKRDYHPNRYGERLETLFRLLTPLAGQLAPNLAPLMEPPIRLYKAAEMLGVMGGDALPALLVAAKHPDTEVRRNAASALHYLNFPVEPAVSTVRELLNDSDPSVRYYSLNCLTDWINDGKLKATPEITEWIVERLSDMQSFVQSRAFVHIVELRMKGKLSLTPVIPQIQRMRNSSDYTIQTLAWLFESSMTEGRAEHTSQG